jgi:7-keto-8-aminopelargonate synthetase-like enzyme
VVLAAARRALALPAPEADARRTRLAARVRQLRRALRARGFTVRGGSFPMQRVPLPDADLALELFRRLARHGVRAVVRRSRCNDEVSLSFLVTAAHTPQQIDDAAAALAAASSSPRDLHAGPSPARLAAPPPPS